VVKNQPAQLDEVFHALASPTRRSILGRLTQGDCTVGELAKPHDMSLAAVAKHIDVLERAGLVSRSRQGRNTNCHLNAAGLAEATSVLDNYRSFWSDQLDALEQYFRNREQASHGSS
jgi:DNA-binding transcriptional ArsR family regulator